jgi:hypothetical protein
MAKIEVDEEEFRASATLRQTIGNWMKNPAARRKLLEANKAFDPKAEIPELDQPDPIEARVAPVADEVAKLRKELADERAAKEAAEKLASLSSKIDKGFEKLRREERLTAQGEEAVRKLMEEEGITNPEIAWSHFQRLHPPQDVITPGGQGAWNFFEPASDDQADDVKKLIESRGQSNSVVDKMARDALNEFRGNSRR